MSAKTGIDVAIGTTSVGSGVAIWMDWIQGGAATVAAVGGALLVIIRVLIALPELVAAMRRWRDHWRDR